jgi:hypothetical protein
LPQDQSGGNLFTGQMVSGIEVRDPGLGSCVELREPSMAMQRERHKRKKRG